MKRGPMFDLVEAALLGSECDPGEAIEQAARALVRFSLMNDESDVALMESIAHALVDRELTG